MSFYLGSTGEDGARVDYDPPDLTTHGVIVGMTGSGKTGLGVILLEEASRQGVPTLVIDPKGDMTNLLLTFPELRPEDFKPWIDEAAAAKDGRTADEEAASEASKWAAGLERSGLSGEDIAHLRDTVGMTIYTPGSEAGVPLNVVGELDAPDLSWDTEAEVMRDEIQGFVSGLLGLVDVDADPMASREHILLSNLIEHAWRSGTSLTLEALISQVATPPIRKLGVFEVDTFFPQKDRMAFAMRLNGLLASPSFASWMSGAPLDIESLLWRGGKPQSVILYIAHLDETERQFIVTTVLSRLITWMRTQAGSSDLRVLAYMDEVFGFVPPTAAPPAKRPILTLLKQARAFGVGLVLSTQNPVDLDYKAMSNAGTWWIGRLQTERDKARILEAVTAASGDIDTDLIDRSITGLAKRQFLLHNTREPRPTLFGTRWAMSYLRGPMTREEINRVTDTARQAARTPEKQQGSDTPEQRHESVDASHTEIEIASDTTVRELDPAAPWSSVVGYDPQGSHLTPAVALTVEMRFDEVRAGIDHTEMWEAVVHPLPSDPSGATFTEVDHDDRDFIEPRADLPRQVPDAPVSQSSYFNKLKSGAIKHLDRNEELELLRNRTLKLTARPGEDAASFEGRMREAADDRSDADMAKLRTKYEARFRKAQRAYETAVRNADTASAALEDRRGDAIVGMGLDLLMGRKPQRATSARSAENRLRNAESKIESTRAAYEDLAADMEDALAAIRLKWDEAIDDVDTLVVGLEADDIRVTDVKLVWVRT
ncbi:MAG: ATP-binding protein [Acidimicrobiia bacterium]